MLYEYNPDEQTPMLMEKRVEVSAYTTRTKSIGGEICMSIISEVHLMLL